MTIDGEHENVLVIKPPMCFGDAEVGQLVRALDSVLLGALHRRGSNLAYNPALDG